MSLGADTQKGNATALMLGALGVVYGDIGTSPIYTIKVAVTRMSHTGPEQVLGLLSLLFWMLVAVVTLKYVIIMLRVDNRGEGGTLALMELARRGLNGRHRWAVYVIGLLGACLFYGDTMVTPAISVLSAMEGIGVVSHRLDAWVVPAALVILTILFSVQWKGTAAMGRFFGPVMLAWFVILGVLGLWRIVQYPQVLLAFDPRWAWSLIGDAPLETYLLLGAVVLALTGAETLYADMGHFGRRSIQRAWFMVVLPCLILCYFGQGALILADPSAARDPFFLMAPGWAVPVLVAVATCATIIASQAVISGAYSVTRQAVQLGFWPRMEIRHTSEEAEGQIYMPRVNALLYLAVVALVLIFRTSDGLAHAYGFAVTGTMLVTSLLAFLVLPARAASGLRSLLAVLLLFGFLVIDVLLFSANTFKLLDGGWVPLVVGAGLFLLMVTWKQGREYMHEVLSANQLPLKDFVEALNGEHLPRVPGTAVFMSVIYGTVPPALLHNLKHNKVLHEQVLFLTVESADVPYVDRSERYRLEQLQPWCWQAVAQWGFKEEPNVPDALRQIAEAHPELKLAPMETSYFLSRQTVIVSPKTPLAQRLRQRLFALMARNATRSTRFYRIPPNRVVEMGMQLELL